MDVEVGGRRSSALRLVAILGVLEIARGVLAVFPEFSFVSLQMVN
jgi:hypothetical protein